MKYFPIFVDVEGRRALVVGGGEAALQKTRLLAKSTARIHVVSPSPEAELVELARIGRIELARREFLPSDLEGASLVYVAGDDAEVDTRIASLAKAWDIPVNVVDRPDHCTFITPAIVDRDPVVVAIGTEGTSPVLAQGIRAHLESALPHRLGALARKAGLLRARVAESLREGASRRAFWKDYFFGQLRDAFLGGDTNGFEAQLDRALRPSEERSDQGRVYLVGAGPGNPDLLTVKAHRLLQEADVIVYDRLAGERVLDVARRDARRIAVGKVPGRPSPGQDEINDILIAEARLGRKVVRLKGGDPYIFGRGAEEQAALAEANVAFEIVPGVTAAVACAASVRLPLTTRGQNRSITLLTGMAEDGPAEHDWEHLARPGSAFAVYMGVGTAGVTQERLTAAGIDPETPAVIVENGSLPGERSFATRIGRLADTIKTEGVRGPAIIFVGIEPAATSLIGAGERSGTQACEPEVVS